MFTFLLTVMGRILGVTLLLFNLHSVSSTVPVSGDPLSAMRWHHRVLVVFAPSEQHPLWRDQQQHLEGMVEGLRERDLLVFRVVGESVSLEGETLTESDAQQWREDFIASEEGFTLVLIGKDGEVKLHQNRPVEKSELYEVIDAMPMRMREQGMGRL